MNRIHEAERLEALAKKLREEASTDGECDHLGTSKTTISIFGHTWECWSCGQKANLEFRDGEVRKVMLVK